MFFNNKFNTFFGLNLTLVYTFPMCMTWRFHFPLCNYDFKFAHSRLLALMSTLVSSIVVHGHVPHYMNESVIVPIIKDKNKRVNDKNNYRPICLSNIIF